MAIQLAVTVFICSGCLTLVPSRHTTLYGNWQMVGEFGWDEQSVCERMQERNEIRNFREINNRNDIKHKTVGHKTQMDDKVDE